MRKALGGKRLAENTWLKAFGGKHLANLPESPK
jgi:hypothetical protein